MNPYEAYMKEIAQPMREELTGRSFEDLTTPEGVDQFMDSLAPEETAFVVINSVCGCAAGLARPAAVTVAEQNPIRPDRKATVFAGQDKEATERMREYVGQAPSQSFHGTVQRREPCAFHARANISRAGTSTIS